jgi:hypothetical protein
MDWIEWIGRPLWVGRCESLVVVILVGWMGELWSIGQQHSINVVPSRPPTLLSTPHTPLSGMRFPLSQHTPRRSPPTH